MLNLLNLVMPMIRPLVDNQGFEYRTYVCDTTNEMGISEPKYTGWKRCEGSVQPMDAVTAQQAGVDVAKNGILVWGSINLNTVDVQDHPDQVRWNNRVFICERSTKWYGANGWNACACTEDKRERADKPNASNPKIEKDDGEAEEGAVVW